MSTPRVSILLTVFNTDAYLAESIDSILGQTLQDVELIIVDDASTDGSWAIAEAAARRDRRVLALRRERCGGASSALNDALRHARGRYIARQDSDDVSLPARLERQASFLDAHEAVAAVGTYARMVDPEGNPLGVLGGPETNEELQAALLDYMCFCGPTVMVRRAAFEAVGFQFDEALSGSEDYDLCLRIGEVGELANLREPLYLYRQHASSVSHRRRSVQLTRKARALENAIRRRQGPVPPRDALANVARDYLRAAVVGHATGANSEVRDSLQRALVLDPAIFENTHLVRHVVTKYTPADPAAALEFTKSLFGDVLPPSGPLKRLRRELVAELHLREAFAGAGRGDVSASQRHLRRAVASHPAVLARRGVVSLLIRQALRRAPFSAASPSPISQDRRSA